jgi:hypothetical protein
MSTIGGRHDRDPAQRDDTGSGLTSHVQRYGRGRPVRGVAACASPAGGPVVPAFRQHTRQGPRPRAVPSTAALGFDQGWDGSPESEP